MGSVKGKGDERTASGLGGTMTGASLGLRSGSYGSVQQPSGALLSTQSPPYLFRKPSKISLSGPRERERILPRICNFAGRRKVRMLLLLVASAAVLSFITVVSKGLACLPFLFLFLHASCWWRIRF